MVYDEFVNHPDPFDMRPTIAALETLAVELRDSIENTNRERRNSYYVDQALTIGKFIVQSEHIAGLLPDADERVQFAKEIVNALIPLIADVFDEHMGEQTTITLDQAKTMAVLIEAKGKMVERYRKLAENATVQIAYDDQLIQFMFQFISQVVIPNISNTQDRIAVATAAKAFLPQMQKAIAG